MKLERRDTLKVVVIGGVAAGMSAASKLKRLSKDTEIKVFEKGSDLSYGACGMPYYLSDMIKDDEALIAKHAKDFIAAGIDVFLQHEVIGLDAQQKQVQVYDAKSGETFNESYDKLIIGTGAHPIRLPVDGKNLKGIHTLNSLQDARQLKAKLDDYESVAVIGAGFIGVEVAEQLAEMGKKVMMIEREDQVMPQFDKPISEHALHALEEAGVSVALGETVEGYLGEGTVEAVKTNHDTYAVDAVIEAIGVLPNTSFLKDTGLEMLKNGAIVTNDKMETSLKDIYAAGDCASYIHRLKKTQAYIPLGTHANKAGRVIAEQIAGNDLKFHGVIGSTVLKVVDLEMAKTGLTVKEAEKENITVDYVDVKARNQAGYYPGAEPIHMRITYDPKTCKLLGAQMIGKKGVSSRINIIATAIMQGLTAEAFSNLDLAYAPPFSPVWDPLQIATNQIKCK